jgi:spermidine/putrescine transport system permease protein
MTSRVRLDLLLLYAVVYMIFIYAPVMLLPLFSFNDSIYVTFPLKGFTTKWYEEMANNPALLAALRNSVEVGVVISIISTAIGLLAAKAITRYDFPGKAAMIGFISLPLVVPYIFLAIALLTIARKYLDIELSLYTIGVSHILACSPFAMLVMVSRLEGFDKNLEEASLDLGEGAWSTFWRITFPLALPGVVASLLLCFTTSFDEYLLAAFLSGNETTLPIYIFSQLRFPARLPSTLALGSCILITSFVVVTFSEWLRRRGVQGTTVSGI